MTAPEQKFPWPPPTLGAWGAAVELNPEPEWLIDKLIPADGVTLISGRPKKGFKSWFVFETLKVLATGQQSGALTPANGPVNALVLNMEGGSKPTWNRWKWLWDGFPREAMDRIHIVHRYPVVIQNKEWIDRISALIVELDVRVLLIDPFQNVLIGNENDSSVIGDFFRSLAYIMAAVPGKPLAVLLVHHMNKIGSARPDMSELEIPIQDSLRGSTAIAGHYDAHLGFRREGDSLYLITEMKEAEETMYSVRWHIDPEGESAKLDMIELDSNDPAPEILEACADELLTNEVYSRKALKDIWRLPHKMFDSVVKALITAEILEQSGRGWRLAGSDE